MTFPRRAQRQALHGAAVGASERRRPTHVGVSALDFMGGRSGSSHVSHAGRHRAAHRADVRGNSWWTLAAVSIGVVMLALGVGTGLHSAMMAAAAAAVLVLVLRRGGNAGTVVPTLARRKSDASFTAPAEADGPVGARSSLHGEGQ
jgi:hypothetical protein